VADGRSSAKDGALKCPVFRTVKMLFVGQEDDNTADKSPQELPDQISGNQGPRRRTDARQTDRYSRVDMRACRGSRNTPR
jgi:hypothetical protein